MKSSVSLSAFSPVEAGNADTLSTISPSPQIPTATPAFFQASLDALTAHIAILDDYRHQRSVAAFCGA